MGVIKVFPVSLLASIIFFIGYWSAVLPTFFYIYISLPLLIFPTSSYREKEYSVSFDEDITCVVAFLSLRIWKLIEMHQTDPQCIKQREGGTGWRRLRRRLIAS